jgi:ankyrin repeat protein
MVNIMYIIHLINGLSFPTACEKGPDCVDLLLEAGAKVDVQDNTENKHTPLHYAAASNNDKAIESLLKHKADVNVVNGAGDTPAHVALASGSVKAIKVLIKHKCDIYRKNNKNTTVWELSQRKEIVSKDARVTFMTELDVVDPREFKLMRKFENKIRVFVSTNRNTSCHKGSFSRPTVHRSDLIHATVSNF